MGLAKDLSPTKKGLDKGLMTETNLSQREIAKKCGTSKTSVANINSKLRSNETLTPKRKGTCGRKKKLSPRGIRQLRKIVLEDRTATNLRMHGLPSLPEHFVEGCLTWATEVTDLFINPD